jgi:hypothetical protein
MVQKKPCVEVVAQVHFESNAMLKNGEKLLFLGHFFVLLQPRAAYARPPVDLRRVGEDRCQRVGNAFFKVFGRIVVSAIERKILNAKSTVVEVYRDRKFFNVPVVQAEAVGIGSFGPFADVPEVFPNPILQRALLILAVGDYGKKKIDSFGRLCMHSTKSIMQKIRLNGNNEFVLILDEFSGQNVGSFNLMRGKRIWIP